MIKKAERIKLRKVLGTRYIQRVLTYLTENNLFNKKGNPYSVGYISHVFNGKEDLVIEKAIYAVYAQILEEYKNFNAEKKAILNKKPEAVTPGS